MSGWRTRAAIGGMALFFLCTLGRLTRLFPFDPAATRWSLQEDYAHSNVPQGPNVRQFRCARSDAGIVIGVDGPGMLEWRFARPGPYPTVIQPFFVPLQGKASRITLALANHPEPRVLARDLPLRNRPLDIGAYVKDTDVFALRFEGVNARLEAIRFFEPSARPPMPWAVILVALMLTGLALWMQDRTMLVLLALSLWGFYLRWNVFATHYSLPLEGDAPGYWSLARAFEWRHLFMTGPREPGFLWVVRAARFAFGDSIRSLRFLGVLASVSWIPLTSELASAAGWPPAVGLGAAALVATNPFAIFMSVQGYPLEFFTLLILLFAIAWLKNREQAMGWLGGLLCVTRAQSFLAIIPLIGLADWKFRWRRRERFGFWVPFLLLTLPYLWAVRQETGSFLGHINRHAGFYEVIEAKDFQKAPPADSVLNLRHFLFARDQFQGRMTALIKGYAQILFDPRDPFNRILLNSHYARAWNLFFLPFFWIGLVLCLMNSKDRWFLWLPLLFLSGLPLLHDLVREPRLLFHVQPFFALITARGIWFIGNARRGS